MAKKQEQTDEPKINPEISKNLLNSLMSGYKDTVFNGYKTEPVVISSGSLKLDAYLRVKSGMVIRMGGPAEVGKTSQSMLFAKNYMDTVPKSKTIYVNAEGKFGDEIQKRTGMKFTREAADWDYGTVFILDSNVFDTVADVLEALFKTMYNAGESLCVIIDSVDMLTLKSYMDKKIGEGRKPAGVNFLTKELFRRVAHPILHFNGLMIMITQYSATFSIDPYEKKAPQLMEGNNTHALNHQASYALYYQPRADSHYIKEDEGEKADPIKNKILGVNARIKISKSGTDETGYTIEIPIKKGRTGNCIWTEKELFDALLVLGLVTKKGAWIELAEPVMGWVEEANKPIIAENEKIKEFNKGKKDDDKKPLLPLYELKASHQGMEKFSNYFEENPRTLKLVVEKVRTFMQLYYETLQRKGKTS